MYVDSVTLYAMLYITCLVEVRQKIIRCLELPPYYEFTLELLWFFSSLAVPLMTELNCNPFLQFKAFHISTLQASVATLFPKAQKMWLLALLLPDSWTCASASTISHEESGLAISTVFSRHRTLYLSLNMIILQGQKEYWVHSW